MLFGESDINGYENGMNYVQSYHHLNNDRIEKMNQINDYNDYHFQAFQCYQNQDYVGLFMVSSKYLLQSRLFVIMLIITAFFMLLLGAFVGVFTSAIVSRRVRFLNFIGMIVWVIKSFNQ